MRVSSERRTRVATATCTSATALRHHHRLKKTMTTTEARRSRDRSTRALGKVLRKSCKSSGLARRGALRCNWAGNFRLFGARERDKLGRTRPYDDRSQTPTSIHTSLDRADHVAVVSLFTASLRVPHSRAIALRRSDSTRRAQAACSTSKERLARGLMTGGSYWTAPVEALWNRICVPVEFTCEIRGEWGRLSCGRDSSQCG